MTDSNAALVTGGTGRVGSAIARRLETDGFRVLAAGRRDGDLSDADAIRALVARAAEELGGLDLVVHAAGEGFVPQPVEAVTEEDWDAAFGATAKGSFFLAQAAAAHLRESDLGLIVLLEDVAAYQPWPSFAPHCAAKAAQAMLTRVLARKLWRRTSACAASPPGRWRSRPGRRSGAPPRRCSGASARPRTSQKRSPTSCGRPFVTGSTLVVDGGRLLT